MSTTININSMEKKEIIEKLNNLKQLVLPNGAEGAVWLDDVLEILENDLEELPNKDIKPEKDMSKLTEFQKDFIFKHFFEDERFVGARNMMESLLEDGSCIVPDYNNGSSIWVDEINHFIEIENEPNAVGCVKYIFDHKKFVNSDLFKSKSDYEIGISEETIKNIQIRMEELKEEIKNMQIQVDDLNSIPKE